jgi:hypothetical protein
MLVPSEIDAPLAERQSPVFDDSLSLAEERSSPREVETPATVSSPPCVRAEVVAEAVAVVGGSSHLVLNLAIRIRHAAIFTVNGQSVVQI